VFYGHHPLQLVCDSGASASIIHQSIVTQCQIPMRQTPHKAKQADGVSKLKPVGEVSFTVTRGSLTFFIEAIVVEELDCRILAGMPFFKTNKIVIDIPNDLLTVDGKHKISYKKRENRRYQTSNKDKSYLVRADRSSVIWPGDYVELQVPEDVDDGDMIAIEPRMDSGLACWIQPSVTTVVGSFIRIPNTQSAPAEVKRHQHLVQIHRTSSPTIDLSFTSPANVNLSKTLPKSSLFSEKSMVDPDDILSSSECRAFNELHARYDNFFNPQI
jgi:hypothetical protein